MKKAILFTILASFFSFSLLAETYNVDTKTSKIKWVGEKVTGSHNGLLKFEKGELTVEDGQITGGEIVVNMKSITNEDLEGKWRKKLLNHLRSDDFFAVDKFPRAKFVIKSVSQMPGKEVLLKGDLIIRGKSEPNSMNVKYNVKDGKLTGKGKLKFDRTKYGIKYNSGSFFENLGDKLIYDEVTAHIDVVAKK